MATKNNYISYLRVIATVFVILIHASTGFLNRFDADSFDWNYANWINSATRCSVPIFVMLSGALLLQKDEDTISFYKKRISKLLLPFAFWTIVYLIYYFYRYTKFSLLSTEKIISIAQDKILHGANAHLWYLYMIVGLYLAIPYLRKIINQVSIKEIEIFLVLWFAAMIVMNKFYYPFVPKFDLTFFSGYLGYLVLGYYLSIKSFNWNKWIPLIGFTAIAIFTAYITYNWSLTSNKFNPHWYNYVFPNTALAAGFLFIFIKKISSQNEALPNWLRLVDEYSFGIYLVHIIPLNYIHPLVSKYLSTLWVTPLATLLTILSSIGIIYVMRKIPYGKYVSG
ncbi:acyltransferase [Sphingobacterium bovistauri]|uniref:Acyltransferase family protein n=1 Tax=Sphingobacterium bovistauri TaxID=2781959 RepID=A0ABS7Z4C8_9SPHI|nr:acyltransferase family protein [Sphingobacterium bovistauri]MCA5005031.1 acyltransferase family protein [Sphingobacterium bovistauri]